MIRGGWEETRESSGWRERVARGRWERLRRADRKMARRLRTMMWMREDRVLPIRRRSVLTTRICGRASGSKRERSLKLRKFALNIPKFEK